MLAIDILKELERRGASVAVEHGKVIITPSSALDDPLRQAIREAKPEIIRAVSTVPAQNPGLAHKSCSWEVSFASGEMSVVYVPAVGFARVLADHPKITGATIAQSCGACLWHLRPGQTDTGYCSSPDRHDQPGPYGEGHPARFLPVDQGAACEMFEVCQ